MCGATSRSVEDTLTQEKGMSSRDDMGEVAQEVIYYGR